MILYPRTQEEYDDTLRLLDVINGLCEHGLGYNPPITKDSPWIRTQWPRPQYL